MEDTRKEEVILKHYNNENINRELRKMFEKAVKDDEYVERFECGGDFEVLMEDIDKTLKYVENGYKGKLYLNSNMWYICQETLTNILALYGLKLVGTDKCTENEEVIVIKRPFREKVFEKMREYGWNLGDNTNKDFADVYDTHYKFIEGCYDYIADCDMNEPLNMNDISVSGFEDMITFMSDFLRALNDIDKPKTKEDKIREYIMSRNIQYDLVGEDLLAILDEEE